MRQKNGLEFLDIANIMLTPIKYSVFENSPWELRQLFSDHIVYSRI